MSRAFSRRRSNRRPVQGSRRRERGGTARGSATPFPCDRPGDRLPRSAREITDATAGVHCGARERSGVALPARAQQPLNVWRGRMTFLALGVLKPLSSEELDWVINNARRENLITAAVLLKE